MRPASQEFAAGGARGKRCVPVAVHRGNDVLRARRQHDRVPDARSEERGIDLHSPDRPAHVERRTDGASASRARHDSGTTRPRPVISVSSVSGVGAKLPVPADSRAVQAFGSLTSAERRGLTVVWYSLYASTRRLADNESFDDGSKSACTNAEGTRKV